MTGCISPYSYKSVSSSDPEFIFGERLGDNGNRGFAVNIIDATENRCNEYMNVGVVSNSSVIFDKSKTIKVPEGKVIAIGGNWAGGNSQCFTPVKLFTPEKNGKYSVDIGIIGRKCFLSIAQFEASGKIEEVKEFVLLPKCN